MKIETKNLLFLAKKYSQNVEKEVFLCMMTNEKNEKHSKCIKKQVPES